MAGGGFEEIVADEVTPWWTWLVEIRISDVTSADEATSLILEVTKDPELQEQVAGLTADVVEEVLAASRTDETSLADAVGEEAYEEIVDAIVGMREVREAAVEQVTTSDVYSELISHVLYPGIKGFVGSEGGITRRVPGASSRRVQEPTS